MKRTIFALTVSIAALALDAAAQSVVTVQVNQFRNGVQSPFPGVGVALVPYSASGQPDPALTQLLVAGANGSTAAVVVNNLDYQILLTTPGYGPSVRDQISDPNRNFHIKTSANVTKTFYLFATGTNCPGCPVTYTMNVAVSAIPAVGDLLLASVHYNGGNSDPVAYGIARATDTVGTTFPVFNVPGAQAGSYGVNVTVAGKDKALDLLLGADFPGTNATVSMDLSNALPPVKFGGAVSTSPPSVDGLVLSTLGGPVDGMRVNLSSFSASPDPSCNCFLPLFQADAFTDANGRFQFFNIPVSTYNFFASKLGFYSVGTQLAILSSTVTYRRNFTVAPATYSITGLVRYGGVPMPWGDVHMGGDGERWAGSDSYSTSSLAGFGHGAFFNANVKLAGDGTFSVVGIPDGNVNLAVGFRGGNYDFNAGANNQREYQPGNFGSIRGGPNSDDLRITVSSIPVTVSGTRCASGCPAGTTIVYTSTGGIVSTGAVVVDLTPPAGANAGTITVGVNFITSFTVTAQNPVVIPFSRPVTVMASEDYRGGNQAQRIGVASLIGTFTSPTTSYDIHVPIGTSYRVDVLSQDWGKVSNHNDSADLSSKTTAAFVFDITRSGRLTGTVKLPDGTNYKPVYGSNLSSPNVHFVNIRARGVTADSQGDVQVDEFGSFEFPNLPPGQYNVTAEVAGAGAKWPTTVLKDVKVYQGQTTNVNIRLKDAIFVQPQIFGLPALSTAAWHYRVQPLPAGTKLTQASLVSFFSDKAGSSVSSAFYSTATATFDVLRMEPGIYDFYLLLESPYNDRGEGGRPANFYFFENFIGQIKGVVVQKSDTNPNLGTAAQPIAVGILGSLGQATLSGHITGSKLFTVADLERAFANFEQEIFKLIPALLIYDDAGDIKGYSLGLPDSIGIELIKTAIHSRDAAGFIAAVAAHPMQYQVSALPPGHYTLVFLNPNYPAVVKEKTLASGANAFEFDFDSQKVLSGQITGVVISSATNAAIPNAVVSLRHRTLDRVVRTDANGKFAVANLPSGTFRIEASKGGFTTAGQKVTLGANGTLSLTFALFPTEAVIQGTVYLTKFPTPAVKDGILVIAYDETANVANPEAYLPQITGVTDSNGQYFLPGILPDHIYKLSVAVPGKLLATLLVSAGGGVTTAPDIVLQDSPPQISLRLRRNPDNPNKLDLLVKSPKQLRSTPSGTFNPGTAYDAASAVSLTFVPGPDNTYLGQFTLSATQRYYAIRVVAGDAQNQLEKVIVFDRVSDTRSEQFVDQAAVAGGNVSIDEEKEDFSGLDLDPGSLTATSTGTASDFSNLVGGFFSALPSVRMVKTGRGDSETVGSALSSFLASEVYDIDLSSAQQNKTLTLTLKYDKAKVTDTGALHIRQYDSAAGGWTEVPGHYTVDPLSGVVSIEVESIEQASAGSSASAPLRSRRYGRAKVSPQGTFVPDATQASSQSGQFAVFSAVPPTNVAYAGTDYEIYNLPNPFNLKTKTIALSSDGTTAFGGTSTDVRGTLIKYHLPSAKGGRVKLLIYNVAGERVREIDEGSRSGGYVYYSQWDGKNDGGSDCASGVYFLLTQVDGKKLGNKAHKMALVK